MSQKNKDLNAEFEYIGQLLISKEFDEAIKKAEHIKLEGYDIPEVHLVKLLAETKTKNMDDLKCSNVILDTCPSYKKVLNVAPENVVKYVIKCNTISRQKNHTNGEKSETGPAYLKIENQAQSEFNFRKKDNLTPQRSNIRYQTNQRVSINETKDNKVPLRILIGTLISVVSIATLMIIIVLANNSGSLSNVSHCINTGNTKCLFMHDFQAASCTRGRLCTRCELEKGSPKGHQWVEATCTESKSCSICGIVEGDPLGHSVNKGKCERCGEDYTELISAGKEIRAKITEINNEMSEAIVWLQTALDNPIAESACLQAARNHFWSAQFDLLDAKQISETYPEFEKITRNLKDAHDALDVSYNDSVYKYSTCGMDCFGFLESVEVELIELIGE